MNQNTINAACHFTRAYKIKAKKAQSVETEAREEKGKNAIEKFKTKVYQRQERDYKT